MWNFPPNRRAIAFGVVAFALLVLTSGVALGGTLAQNERGDQTATDIAATAQASAPIAKAPPRQAHEPREQAVERSVRASSNRHDASSGSDGSASVTDELPQSSSGAAWCKEGFERGQTVEESVNPLQVSSSTISGMVDRYNQAAAEGNVPDFVGDLVEERMLVRITRGPSHDSTVQLYAVRTGSNDRVTDVTKLDADSISSFDPQVELKVESGVATGMLNGDDPSRVAKQALKTGRIDVDGRGLGNGLKYGVAERIGRIQTKYFDGESESPYAVEEGEQKRTNWKGSEVTLQVDELGRTVVSPPEDSEEPPPGDTTVIDPGTGIAVGVTGGSCCRTLSSVHTGELSASAGVYASVHEVGCFFECSVDGSHTAKVEMVLVQQGFDPKKYDGAKGWINSVGTIGSILSGDLTGALYGGEFLDTGFAASKTRGFTVWAKATCQECDVNTCYACWNESDLVNDGVRYKKVAEFHEGVRATGDSDGDGTTEFEPVKKPEGYVGADFTWEKFHEQMFSPVAKELRLECGDGGFR